MDENKQKEQFSDAFVRAVAAHRAGGVVRCSGVLKREGRAFRLYEPYDFGVDPDES